MRLDSIAGELDKERLLLQEEMRAEAHASRKQLQGTIESNMKEMQDEMRSIHDTINAKLYEVTQATEDKTRVIQSMKSAVDSLVQAINNTVQVQQYKDLFTQVEQARASLEGITTTINSLAQATQNTVQLQQYQDLAEQVEKALKSQERVDEQTEAIQQAIEAQSKAVQESVEGIRKLVEELPSNATSICCPAPPGYDQQVYDSMLTGAAWFYISHFQDRDGGVEPDEDALDAMTSRFPELNFSHMLQVLEKVHTQVYKKPLTK